MKNAINKIKNSKFWNKFNDWIITILIVEAIITGRSLFISTMKFNIPAIAAISTIIGLTIISKILLFLQWNGTEPEKKATTKEIILILCDFVPRLYIMVLILCKKTIYLFIGIEFIRFLTYLFAVIPAFDEREISINQKRLFTILVLVTSILELLFFTFT